jgi:hypothetical protein
MNARPLLVLSIVVLLTTAGCGGLSEASTQACTEGKKTAAYVKGLVDSGPPEATIGLAKSAAPKFDALAGKADDEDVKSSLANLSKTFAGFAPDMSKRPTALRSFPEFTKYVDDFEAEVAGGVRNLDEVCS